MREVLVGVFDSLGWAWWIRITTETPNCTYYFGPFLAKKEALAAKAGYLEDINGEGASCVNLEIKRCKPKELTVCDEIAENIDFSTISSFSSQPY
jgi:hypothetical protein